MTKLTLKGLLIFVSGALAGLVLAVFLYIWDLNNDVVADQLESMTKQEIATNFGGDLVEYYCKTEGLRCEIEDAEVFVIHAGGTVYVVWFAPDGKFGRVFGRNSLIGWTAP